MGFAGRREKQCPGASSFVSLMEVKLSLALRQPPPFSSLDKHAIVAGRRGALILLFEPWIVISWPMPSSKSRKQHFVSDGLCQRHVPYSCPLPLFSGAMTQGQS